MSSELQLTYEEHCIFYYIYILFCSNSLQVESITTIVSVESFKANS